MKLKVAVGDSENLVDFRGFNFDKYIDAYKEVKHGKEKIADGNVILIDTIDILRNGVSRTGTYHLFYPSRGLSCIDVIYGREFHVTDYDILKYKLGGRFYDLFSVTTEYRMNQNMKELVIKGEFADLIRYDYKPRVVVKLAPDQGGK